MDVTTKNYIIIGVCIVALVVLKIVLSRLRNESGRKGGVTPIVRRTGFNSEGVTDGARVVIGWDELEKVVLVDMETLQGDFAIYLLLAGGEKSVVIRDTAAGWDELFERLEKLPGADPDSIRATLALVTPGSGLKFTLWDKEPEPSAPPLFAVTGGDRPALISYLSQTLIIDNHAERTFELARFEGEPANVRERLLVAYADLDGFRIWWRGSVLMRGWADGDDERIPVEAPEETYYGLQVWPRDPEWAGFRIDLARRAVEEDMENILSNLSVEWYSRLGAAVRHG